MDNAIFNAFVRGSSLCDDLLKTVLMGGAVNFQRKLASNTTALMAAAHCCRPDIIQALLDKGARARLCDSHGRTAYDFAVHSGHRPSIQLLHDVTNTQQQQEQEQQHYQGQQQPPPPPTFQDPFGETTGSGGSGGIEGADTHHMKVDHLEVEDEEDDTMCYDYFVMQEGGEQQEQQAGEQQKRTRVGKARAFVTSHHFSLFEEQEQKEEAEDREHMQAWMEEQQMDDCENMDENFEEFDENHENFAGNDYGELTSDESDASNGYEDALNNCDEWF